MLDALFGPQTRRQWIRNATMCALLAVTRRADASKSPVTLDDLRTYASNGDYESLEANLGALEPTYVQVQSLWLAAHNARSDISLKTRELYGNNVEANQEATRCTEGQWEVFAVLTKYLGHEKYGIRSRLEG